MFEPGLGDTNTFVVIISTMMCGKAAVGEMLDRV